MVIGLLGPILQLISHKNKPIDFIFFIFLILSLILIGLIIYILIRKNFRSEFDGTELREVKEKAIYIGKKRYALKLQNGPERDLDKFSKT